MPDKKYLIEIPGMPEGSGIWEADKWERNKDAFMAQYPNANVFELGEYDAADSKSSDQIMLTFDDDEVASGVWDVAKWERNREAFLAENPNVRVHRVRYTDYWGERATANREQRAALTRPDADRNARLAAIGYYDDLTEGQHQFSMNFDFMLKPLSSAIKTSVVTGQTTYLDPAVQEFFATDSADTERMAEIARLDAEYERNPAVIAQREWESKQRAEQGAYIDTQLAAIRAEMETEVDALHAAQGAQTKYGYDPYGANMTVQAIRMLRGEDVSQDMVENEEMETYQSAIKLFDMAKQANEIAGKGFWGAVGDVAMDKLRNLATQSDVEMYNEIGNILTRLESQYGSLENLTDEQIESGLSKAEQALIRGFFAYNEAMEAAGQDMSSAYKGGKIFGESISFMLEFLATGGVARGTGKAAGNMITKGLFGWARKAAAGTARRGARKFVARAARKLTSAMVGTAARTLASPGTYNRMAEESVKIEDGHLHRGKNAFVGFVDAYIENLSEISGGLIGDTLKMAGINPAKVLGKISFGKIGQLLADNRLAQGVAKFGTNIFGEQGLLKKFGFNGIFEEVEEEYIGNLIRELTIQDGALAEMHKDGNFGSMLIGFAPMTLFGAGISAAKMTASNIEAANLGKKLRETLGYHYSEEQIDHMMNLVQNAENADELSAAITPLLDGLNAEEAQQLWQYGAFMAQNKAMLFARKAQDDSLAQAKRAEYQQQFGNFWQTSEDGAESVQIAELRDGRTVFVTSAPNESGMVTIIDAETGRQGFSNVSEYAEQQDKEGNINQKTRTWAMDAFLESRIASERLTAQEARMSREYNEQVQNLQSQITSGTKINLGTEGNPIWMVATGEFSKNGVSAVDSTGATHTIGWMQVADAMKQPIRVKTDQEIIDEEVAAVVARNAERRKSMLNPTPAMTDAVNESATQTGEVVAQENKHIPMNEDGTVNEAAFWEQDPEGYVQWNDEQNQDGGADSLQQVAITKAVLTSLLAEAQQAQQTSNPAERKAAKLRAQEIAEKIDRLTAIEASYAEQRIAPLRERALKWKNLTNAPVYIVETEEELASISGQAAESNKGGARVRGFAKDGKAYIYLPGIVEESEIDAVFMHEAVAHTGLKGMLGQLAFDQLCDQVWEMMSPEARQVFIDYPGVNGDKRAAADEYIAHIAERMGSGVATAEEKTIWQKVVDFVRNVLRAMGIDINISESELADLLQLAYKDLAENMAEAEKIVAQQQKARVAAQNAPSTARQEYDTYAEDLTHDEIKAVAENEFNAAQKAYDALAASAPKVEMGESAKDFIARKKAYNEQLAEAKAALDARQALIDEIARIDAANAPVLTDAEVLEQEGLGVDTQNDDVRMSVRYVPTEKQREMIIGSIMNVTGRTREEAERWLASETSLAAMITEDLQYLDYVADPKYKAIKDNSDYPQGTVDFNNICRKRLPFTRMFTRLQRRFPNRVFTAEELADIRTIMSKDDLMVACGLCYVEDRRQMVGEVAQSFIDGLQEQFKTYANNPTKKKNAKKFNELIAGDTYVPQVYDLTTQEGLDKLYNEHRGIWEAFQAFNNARGQQSQNLLQGYAEYKREILSWSDKKVKSVNDNGGLRIFSYSDFEAHHLIDVVQIIIDCAAKGVKVQGYTKVPEFARAVANTGIKLNRSLIPLGDTGLVDGQLAFDPVEGIDINDPNFLESNDNVGNILIGINDEQIRIAMADPRIHYIIPYHARQKENIRQKLNVGAWTNYISTQNERNISDGKRVKDNINIYTDILTGDVTTDRQFVEKYLQLCKEQGRIPKFDQFLERDAEGNYLYTPGYYKFLVDFKLFDENGNILPQQPVVAEFDDAFNMQILENYAKDERESTGEQMNETYDKIVDALGLDESAAEGEDVRFSTVKEIADKFNAELQQQIDGTLPDGHVYQLGVPGAVLASTGIPNLPITLQASVLNVKANDPLHPFALEEIRDLVPAIQRPWAIFKYGDSGKAQNLIVGIAKEDKQFLVGLSLSPTVKGKTLYINSVRNVFPKDNDEWLNWIQQGKLLRVDEKEKIQAIIDALRINPVDYTHLDLDSIAKVVNDFVNPNIASENEGISFSVRTDEQREKLFADAKAQFGLTNNFKVAGYMLPDGSLLDFSEANDGGDPNQRSLDHREIEGIIMDEGREYDSRWMYLADFMNEGAIRLLPEYAGINLMKAPTKEQRSRLFDFIYKYNGEVILEIADERLNNVAYVEYDRRTSPSRIFRDIDGYFNEGIVPEQDVRFSVFEPHNATIDEIDGLFREYNMDESLVPLYDKVSALAHTMDLKIRFDYPWSAAAGSTFGDKVKFNTEFFNSLAYMPQDKAHALLHEMIHATTNYAIAARNTGALTEGMKEAVSQLESIYGEIMNDRSFDGTYGARSIYEMVAELSNPDFRNLLKEKNLFQRIVDAIKRLLGIEVGENALDNLSATLDYMLDNYDGRVFGAVVNQYQKHQEYTRFSVVNENQAIFVSNAARAVEGIKMEKATPAQWLAMIEKSGGLKAGEDKWMGLSDWLTASDRKTLTKQDVLDFIGEHKIKIEEVHYDAYAEDKVADAYAEMSRILQDKFNAYRQEYYEQNEDDDLYGNPANEYAIDRLREELEDEFPYDIEMTGAGDVYFTFPYEQDEDMRKWSDKLGVEYNPQAQIEDIRLNYTTYGLTNKREIALTVPTIDPWNEGDLIHFGDAGDGRAVAWIRFGETEITEEGSLMEYEPKNDVEREIKDYIEMGMNRWGYPFEECVGYAYNQITDAPQESVGWTEEAVTAVADGMRGKARRRKILVIDEIQSKRHQEGREKGYTTKEDVAQRKAAIARAKKATNDLYDYIGELVAKYPGTVYSLERVRENRGRFTEEENNKLTLLIMEHNYAELELEKHRGEGVPDAPFEKNWHELAMKRMLRYAAEEGYDAIAWTKGEQQAERYNIGEVVNEITRLTSSSGKRTFEIEVKDGSLYDMSVNEDGVIDHTDVIFEDTIGKHLSEVFGKEIADRMMTMHEKEKLNDLRIGGEGMRGFYDKMLPAFMNKYGKKWGVKVADITLPDVEEAGQVMHSVPVTEEMKASVMEGQVMFSAVQIDPAVRQEMDTIKAKAMWDGTFMKAPNGAETKLTEEQWLMVRTKNFLNWFGDWINDPENASKVVDENGEPMVVYHGTGYEGNVFTSGFFASDEQFATDYGFAGNGFNSRVVSAFIKMANPRVVDADYANYDEIKVGGQTLSADDLVRETKKDGVYDGLIIKNVDERSTDGFNWTDDIIPFAPSQIKSATETTGEFSESEDIRFSAVTEAEEVEPRFSVVTDPALLDQLNNEEYIPLYRAMQVVDGKLYPPMAGKVAFKEGEEASWGEPTPEQTWLQSDETPWNAVHARYDEDSKDGKHKKGDLKYDKNGDPVWVFKLDKGNGKTLYAAYNPYIHTSASPLNDQFSEAQSRSNLVVVRVLVPKSELTSGYKAEKAKDSVGMKPWHKGPISGVLAQYEGKGREVMLTRYAKIDGIVDFSEVADETMRLFEGTGLLDHPLPTNVFMPGLREELEKRGVQFVETTNKGEIKEGADKGKTWASIYGKDGLGKKPKEPKKSKKANNVRFSAISTPTDNVVAEGMKFSIQDFARLAGNIFQDMPESFRKEAIEETFKRGWDMQSAIFQIPARLAEKENWDESDKDLAKVIREKVQDAMDESGVVMSRPLTTKEALWMLYRSTEANSDSMLDAAKRSIVASNLGFDGRSMALKEKADDYIRYSMVRNGQIDAATEMYNYEANLWTSRLKESWLDMNQSVIALQNALERASGKPVASWENVVLALNQLSSKSYADKKKYMRDFLMPLWNTIIEMVKTSGMPIEQFERYMMLKHGLERNKKFAMRDAKQFYREMYDKVADRMKNSSHAEQVVALSEANKRIADIDAQIATAKDKKLKDLQEARERAVVEKEIAELVLRNDEQQNEADLLMYFNAIEAENNPKYAEFREKDYGGLTSMFMDQIADVKRSDYKTDEAYQAALLASVKPRFDKIADMEDAALKEVDDYESRADMAYLWRLVNAATKETLRHQHASGMITTEQYDAVRNMFDYYVPLRGFADNTAEDMYSYYMNNSAGGFAKPIIAAKGRKTRAESPLGWIGTMAESAIQQDNKNEAKMKLYYALMNRPDTGVLSLSEMWYVYDYTDPYTGKKVFVPAYPPATNGVLTADQMRQHMDAWEQSMKAKQAIGEAYKREQGVNLGGSVIFQDKAQDTEHIIRVKVAGKDFAILVNGNPRAAQAINGMLNPDANVGPVGRWYGELRRGMSSLMTSFSPLFWVANYQRDLLSSFMRTSLNEGWGQAFKYLRNRAMAWRVAKYVYAYEDGAMGDSYYEKLYKEFAENGGITGYTFLTTNKEYEKILADYAKHIDQDVLNWIKGVWDKFMGFGEAIEQVSRFAAYITAKESGKSIEEAVAAAKEVSVNFNRKGSATPISLEELEKLRDKNGKPLSMPKKAMAIVLSAMPKGMKELYFFFNASIQALSSSARLAAKSPGKATAWAGMYMGLSVGLAAINYLLAGDDDDNDYLDLPDYLRHSTALVKMGDNYYFKWSLPQEMRPFYAIADILVSKAMGKMQHKTAKDVGRDMALAMAEWLPVNPFGTEDPILALVPDAFAPLAEIKANQNSFGGRIYNDMSFMSEEVAKQVPAYRKGTSKTGRVYVDVAELLNDISGGDEVQKGWLNVNPAIAEHLVEGYGGGIYDFAKMMISLPGLIISDDPVEVRDIPFVNKVILSTDETNMNSHVNEAFYYYQGIADNAKRVESEYRKSDDPSRADDYRHEDDWRIYLLMLQYDEYLKAAKQKVDDAADETEREVALQEQNAIREMLLQDIARGTQPDASYEIAVDLARIKAEANKKTKAGRDARAAANKAGRDPYVSAEEYFRLRDYADSLQSTAEYERNAELAKAARELEKKIEQLRSTPEGSERDSLMEEIQRQYNLLLD